MCPYNSFKPGAACCRYRGGHPPHLQPRTSRPVDPRDRGRLHPPTPGPRPGRRRPAALGETPRTRQTHPRPHPTRASSSCRTPAHPRQTTKIRPARTRTPQRHQHRTPNPSSRHQKGRLTGCRKILGRHHPRLASVVLGVGLLLVDKPTSPSLLGVGRHGVWRWSGGGATGWLSQSRVWGL